MTSAASFSRITAQAATSEFLKYEEVIKKLNTLQSNASVLQEAAKKQIQINNSATGKVQSTVKYLKRSGINVDKFTERVIHVSGTKGKGSTAMLTESLLRSVPYKTGLYVSPHLMSVRERISLNGSPLSQKMFVDYFWQVYNKLWELKEDENDMPTYFKFLTIMALKVFISEDVDVAIIEVGVGGECDCTNIFENTPIVGITSIGLDHTKILGDTEEKIAWQKAGILKRACRAFTLPDHKESVLEVIKSRAIEKQCQLEIVSRLSDYSWNTTGLSPPQKLNASLALQLAKAWEVWKNNQKHTDYNKMTVSEREDRAIRECQTPGRCQVVCSSDSQVTYYLDGAHTRESVQVAKEWYLANAPANSKKILIFNVTGNRTTEDFLVMLKDCQFSQAIFCTNWVSTETENLPPDMISATENLSELRLKCEENLRIWDSLDCGKGSGRAVSTVAEAISLAGQAPPPTSVFVTGSLHLVGAVLSLIQPLS